MAGQKAQLERTVAELTATLSARQKDFDAKLRLVLAQATPDGTVLQMLWLHEARGMSTAEASWRRSALRLTQYQAALCPKALTAACCLLPCCAELSDMERRHLQDKEKMRKEHAAKIRETKVAMAQLAGTQALVTKMS